MDDTTNPASIPASLLCASSIANGYPPISFAKIVANIDGSAPQRLKIGIIIGPSTSEITGAKQTIPTIPKANGPIELNPSSNCSPSPNLFPIILSNAPKSTPTAIMYNIILSKGIFNSSYTCKILYCNLISTHLFGIVFPIHSSFYCLVPSK